MNTTGDDRFSSNCWIGNPQTEVTRPDLIAAQSFGSIISKDLSPECMTTLKPIYFFNRLSGKMEQEAVYGEGFLKWAYGNPLGRLTVQALVKRAIFSQLYGWWMSRSASAARIAPFVQSYRLDASEFEGALESYGSFNDFFSRRLRPGARPIDPSSESVVFPADGRHLGFQDLSKVDRVFAKGQSFDLKTLFQDESLADRFHQGAAVFSRLCPVDYHRFHFATSGCPEAPRLINGPLFSVNPMALRQQLAYLWQNKRMLTRLRSERLGEVLILEIGATNVGSIIQTHQPNQEVSKGDEKGYFRFGGSATMTFFEPGRVVLAHDLLNHTAQGIELYAPMGDVMGQMR